MEKHLEILDTYLRKLRADFYSQLNELLKENEIKYINYFCLIVKKFCGKVWEECTTKLCGSTKKEY
ncbi:hypothetical protein RBU49_06170 [Clostridium sp. MB40-C1]|uniref:hypothetical protein n=1 Tax=Clostridium sp. MB40-C1 TaxID=3070996 RepID=UPI0027DF2370|nr:hypothetical protein [Clostridium sp. MB40-C1]WMJ81829.1 hypothetical protein RBU49_06170 [Clostridium sp. MB40-C1]